MENMRWLGNCSGYNKNRAVIFIVFGIDARTQARASTFPCGTTSQLLSSDKYFMKPLRATVPKLV
jgi:hypothetical protein